MSSTTRQRFITAVVMVTLLLIGAWLRFRDIGVPSLWYDELGHILAADHDNVTEIFEAVRVHQAACPLDYILLHFWMMLVPQTEFAIRLLYVFYGLISITLLYTLAKMLLYNNTVAMLAAFFLAISPIHIAYSKEIRFYSLFVLLSLLSTVVYLLCMHHPDRAWRWVIYSFMTGLALYTHLYALLLLSGHFLHLLTLVISESREKRRVSRKNRLRMIGFSTSSFAIILMFLPWVINGGSRGGGIARPSITPAIFATAYISSLFPGRFWALVFSALALLGCIDLAIREKSSFALLVYTGVLSVPIVYGINYVMKYPHAHVRQVLFAQPFYILFIADGFLHLRQIVRTKNPFYPLSHYAEFILKASVVIIASIYVINSVAAVDNFLENHHGFVEDWRTAGRFLNQNVRVDEAIISPFDTRISFYLEDNASPLFLVKSLEEIEQITGKFDRVWFIVTKFTSSGGKGKNIAAWLSEHAIGVVKITGSTSVILVEQPSVNKLTRSMNLAPNASFESGKLTEWHPWGTQNGTVLLSSSEARTGQFSLEVLDMDKDNCFYALSNDIPIFLDKGYAFSVWIRDSSEIERDGIQLGIAEYQEGKFMRWSPVLLASRLPSPDGWVHYKTLLIDLGKGVDTVRLGIFPFSKGTETGMVLVDDIEFCDITLALEDLQ